MTQTIDSDQTYGLAALDPEALEGRQTFAVHDPATGEVIAQVPDTPADRAGESVARAAEAFASWRTVPPRERAEVLRAAWTALLEDKERLAGLIMAENGKSRADAESEVTYAAEFFRWYAEESVRPGGDYGPAPAGGVKTLVTHQPVGVAALITPWNFPAAMATRKIAPALAAGCAVVLKPASETPLTAFAIAELLEGAGVPAGLVNVVASTDASGLVGAWLADDRVRKVSFTGSTGVGRTLLKQAAERVVNASMELGGNAPFIVTADADIEAAVAGALIAKFRNGGQACTAANRFYVHADIAEEFVAAFGAKVDALSVGRAQDGAQIGPVISEKAEAGITELIEDAVAGGAVIAHQAQLADGLTGHFIAPTVLTGVAADARVVTEEIFGPVAPILTWTDEDQVITAANDTEFGLAAYVYAGSLQQAVRIGERLEAGMVGVNRGIVSDPAAPFGGFKQSGIGREGARDGLLEFTETQYLSVDWP